MFHSHTILDSWPSPQHVNLLKSFVAHSISRFPFLISKPGLVLTVSSFKMPSSLFQSLQPFIQSTVSSARDSVTALATRAYLGNGNKDVAVTHVTCFRCAGNRTNWKRHSLFYCVCILMWSKFYAELTFCLNYLV